MKWLFILLIPINCLCQELAPVWGTKWGSSIDEVISQIKKSKGFTPDSVNRNELLGRIYYMNKTFDGYKSFSTTFFFKNGRFIRTETRFLTKDNYGENVFLLHSQLKKRIVLKYFEPQHCSIIGDNKYQDEMLRTLKDWDNLYCNWFFPKDNNSQLGGIISLQISDKTFVTLIYDYTIADNHKNSEF